MVYKYPAIKHLQAAPSRGDELSIVTLVAPCDEMMRWTSLPRELEQDPAAPVRRYASELGFERLSQLATVYQSSRDKTAPFVLLALRFEDRVRFRAETASQDGCVQLGAVEIETHSGEADTNQEILDELLSRLELGRPNSYEPSEEMVSKWVAVCQRNVSRGGYLVGDVVCSAGESIDCDPFSPDVSIQTFYEEVKLRRALCGRLPLLQRQAHVLGLGRRAALEYLAPASVIDGQQMLLAANDSLKREVSAYLGSAEFEAVVRKDPGIDAVRVENEQVRLRRSHLNVRLVMKSDWGEAAG
jgi:hypothetical protein